MDADHRWVLHCGDAFYYRGTIDGQTAVPRSMKLSESMIADDRKRVRDNHARLTELYARREPDLLIVSAHDPTLLADAIATSRGPLRSARGRHGDELLSAARRRLRRSRPNP